MTLLLNNIDEYCYDIYEDVYMRLKKKKKEKEKKITVHLENYSADINFKCGTNKIKFRFWVSRNGTDN